MSVIPLRSEVSSRGARMLRTALGGDIARWLDEPDVIEVMFNPDGRLWVDRLGEGLAATEYMMSAADGERIIRLVAHHVGVDFMLAGLNRTRECGIALCLLAPPPQ